MKFILCKFIEVEKGTRVFFSLSCDFLKRKCERVLAWTGDGRLPSQESAPTPPRPPGPPHPPPRHRIRDRPGHHRWPPPPQPMAASGYGVPRKGNEARSAIIWPPGHTHSVRVGGWDKRRALAIRSTRIWPARMRLPNPYWKQNSANYNIQKRGI